MDTDLSHYRKIVTLIVTAAVVFALTRFGLSPTDLPAFGFNLTGIAEPVVEFLLTIGIPAVFALAQPNEDGDSIFRWWRWVAAGLGMVAVLVIVALAVL